MILFKLCYGEEKKNLSVDNYFMIGDLLEASLIKFELRDEDIDYIYFKYENKIIILGTDELRFNDNINDLITKYNIPEYTLILKKRYTYDINSILLHHQINDSMYRLIYNRFKLYLQERNDKMIAERLQNEEKKNIVRQSYNSYYHQPMSLSIPTFTPNNTIQNNRLHRNININFPPTTTINSRPQTIQLEENSDDYDDSIDYDNCDSFTTSNDSIDENEEKNMNESKQTIYTTPYQRQLQIIRNNPIIQRHSQSRLLTQSQIERKNMLMTERNNTINRIREIERKYGIDTTQNNSSSSSLTSIIGLINRTVGLINIHDIFNEYTNNISNNINQINELNQNINNQNISDNILEDVKIVMSEEEFDSLDDIKYIDYINSIRPDDIIELDIDEESKNEYDIKDRDCCSICTDDFENNSIITKLPTCTHFFHKGCIKRWLTECKNKCPLCNSNVSENPVYY